MWYIAKVESFVEPEDPKGVKVAEFDLDENRIP
jgi:hypothetical protein